MEKKKRSIEELKQLQKDLDPKEVKRREWEEGRKSCAPLGRVFVRRKDGNIKVIEV